MPTTSNFGWTTPADTDLVKDGAAAIRTLGNGIDTSFLDLKGGTTGQVLSKASNTDLDFSWVAQDDSNAIQNALLTTTGDTIYASAASTPARLGIGSTGQVLTVAGGLPTWAAPAGMTSIASGTLSTAQVSITGISGSYNDLYLVVNDPYVNVANPLAFRLNTIAGSAYESIRMATNSTSLANDIGTSYFSPTANLINLPTATSNFSAFVYIRNYTSSVRKFINSGYTTTGNSFNALNFSDITNAITSIQIRCVNGTSTFSGGTYTLYGVK